MDMLDVKFIIFKAAKTATAVAIDASTVTKLMLHSEILARTGGKEN